MTPKDLRQALPLFKVFLDRFTPRLVDDERSASRRDRADAYLRGLLLDAESTKTAESIALKVHGDPSQVRMTQVFLADSRWDDEPLRDELVSWVDEELGTEEGTLIVDESGFPKCGKQSVGVARQYCGATGKIDNCQMGVFLTYCRWRFSREPVSRGHWANPRARGSRERVSQGVAGHEKRMEGRQRGD